MRRLGTWASLAVAVGLPAAGQMRMLRTSDASSLRTPAGTFPLRTVEAPRAPGVLVLLAADSFVWDDVDWVRNELSELQKEARGQPLTLALVTAAGVQTAGPYTARPAFEAALREIATLAPPLRRPAPARIYDAVTAALTASEGGWSHALVVGNFGMLAPELAGYAAAALHQRALEQRRQISWWQLGAEPPAVVQTAARLTGGTQYRAAAGFADWLNRQRGPVAEWQWEESAPAQGFVVERAELLDAAGAVVAAVPHVRLAAGTTLPGVETYTAVRTRVERAREHLAARQMASAVSELQQALGANPRDREGLRVAADLYREANDHRRAAEFLGRLAEVEPSDGSLELERGRELLSAGDLEGAEKALERARERHAGGAEVAEQLGRLRLARGDTAGAAALLEESLKARPERQEVWFELAEVEQRRGRADAELAALERGVALGGAHAEKRAKLARWYLDQGRKEDAARQADAAVKELPADPAVRATWAGYLEELGRTEAALALWSDVLRADATHEGALAALIRLETGRGDFAKAEAAAMRGLETSPKSARLHAGLAATLEAQGRYYAAAHVMRRAAAQLDDAGLLERAAEMEDRFGAGAPAAYQRLAAAHEKRGNAAARRRALERGLGVAQREGDVERVGWFRGQMGGGRERAVRAGAAQIWIPGGRDALAFAARGKLGSPASRFLVDYARTALHFMEYREARDAAHYAEAMADYFARLGSLLRMATRRGDRSVLSLSVTGGPRKQTEPVLELLGWRLRPAAEAVTLEAGEKTAQARRQDLPSALAIDQAAMEDAFRRGKPFEIEIPWERAPMALDEAAWKNVRAVARAGGGLLEAIGRNVGVARVYLAVSALDEATARALAAAAPLDALVEKYSGLLRYCAPALAVAQGRVVTPGGPAAEATWEKLAGASVAQPPQFFRRLLEQDDGRLLGYFYTLAQLDAEHQRFVTGDAARTARFYELYKESPEVESGPGRPVRGLSFLEFLREIPLEGGRVAFPGGPETWRIAKGHAASLSQSAKLHPAKEGDDEILARLARGRYRRGADSISELENFLAVVRIEQHRNRPLEARAALLLARHHADSAPAYPYFSSLRALGAEDFEQFFRLAEKWKGQNPLEVSRHAGLFEPLLEILHLSVQAGTVTDDRAAELFRTMCDGFLRSAHPSEETKTALEVARLLGGREAASIDANLRGLLLGRVEPAQVEIDGAPRRLDPAKTRETAFLRVLDLQKITPLGPLVRLADLGRALAGGEALTGEKLAALKQDGELVRQVEAEGVKLEGRAKTNVRSFRAAKVTALVRELGKTGPAKTGAKDTEKLNEQLLDAIGPHVRLALTGIVYAYYLRPEDLLVESDPLLARKHQFVNLGERVRSAFQSSEAMGESGAAGTYFVGGFSGFAELAAKAAAGARASGASGGEMLGEHLGAVRTTAWNRLRDEDLRLFHLKVLTGKEWCVEAAKREDARRDLAQETLGLLSLARRHELLEALAAGDWPAVWQAATLSDLYFLGDRWLHQYGKEKEPWNSPVTRALRELAGRNDGARVNLLGANLLALNGCNYPRLAGAAPYEEYERHMFPDKMLERTAELKLYLAEYVDQKAWPAAAMAAAAEPVMRQVLSSLKMTDIRDWAAVVAAHRRIGDDLMLQALLGE